MEEELPFTSDVAKTDDIKLQEITKNAARSTENLIEQLEGESSEDLPMYEVLGLGKQLRSIGGFLKVGVAKKAQLEERIKKEKRGNTKQSRIRRWHSRRHQEANRKI